MSENTLIKVENLKKYYVVDKSIFSKKCTYAKSVDDISFKISTGKILGLVGESGCGKSTTAKTILNLTPPTFGKVTFDNKVIFDVEKNIKLTHGEMTSLRKDMQIIFQDPNYSLDPKMNIGNILTEGIKRHKIATGKDAIYKAQEMLEKCGLDASYINRYPHEFSGGQRQRIGIGRALSLNPKFVVCDEPTAALDVSIQSQILNLMLDLKSEYNLTYLFISHNLNVVRFFCDDIAVMYLGVIVEQASSDELYKHPLHPYTQALLSSIPKSSPLENKTRIKLKGSVSSNICIPGGCRLNPRCPYAEKICFEETPELKEVSPGHFVACHKVFK